MDAQSATPVHAPQSDAAKNKWFGVLAYCWILCLIPLLAAKNSPFAQHHAKQGTVLFLAGFALWLVLNLIWIILPGGLFGLYSLLALIENLAQIGLVVLAIVGIVYAWQGEMKELPVVGAWAKKFKF